MAWTAPVLGGEGEIMIRTPVCDLLQIDHPIALGGMGSVSLALQPSVIAFAWPSAEQDVKP
jgi:hypothetical protein